MNPEEVKRWLGGTPEGRQVTAEIMARRMDYALVVINHDGLRPGVEVYCECSISPRIMQKIAAQTKSGWFRRFVVIFNN